MTKLPKIVKILFSLTFLILIIASLVYKNVIAPDDKNAILYRLGDSIFPLFMMFSVSLLAFKTRKDRKERPSLSEEDKALFANISHQKEEDKK